MANSRNGQRGVMLLEALIGMLVFSVGILALVYMQGAAIKNGAQSKSRSDAALLANGADRKGLGRRAGQRRQLRP